MRLTNIARWVLVLTGTEKVWHRGYVRGVFYHEFT